jgi:magnesium chelatase subunit D
MPGEALPSPMPDALAAAAIFATDPLGTGVLLRAGPGRARDQWLAWLRALWPAEAPLRRVPAGVPDDRLLGGLDLAATLAAGRPIAERGILAASDGGALLLAMSERLPPATAGRIAAVMDAGEVVVQRDGIDLRLPARCGVIALDEGLGEDEHTPRAIVERLAIHLGLAAETLPSSAPAAAVAAARARLDTVSTDAPTVHAVCAVAAALGIASLRAPLQALRVARAAAALAGRGRIEEPDVALAARLVLAPRATRLPPAEDPAPDAPAEPDPAPPPDEQRASEDPAPLEDVLLAAATAAIPKGLLAGLRLGAPPRGPLRGAGRAGAERRTVRRGRPAGTRTGTLRGGDRLALVETLRAAAPWQGLRRLEAASSARRVIVRREDIRLVRLKARSQTTTIFAVDASGSAALARLAEAKGAVELLLADCYVRRDTVALVAFRGASAELVLPPTGSLARARRCLAGLPGGGGTPLAAALDMIAAVADSVARKGRTPVAVLLTDGRANVARDGTPGRAQAEQDALDAARRLRASGLACLLIDTAPRPQAAAERIAREMGARYLALPYADAATVSRAARAGIGSAR